jgi:hypothetical protein
MAKRVSLTLDSLVAVKPSTASAAPESAMPAESHEESQKTVGQTLRLRPAAWKQLKQLALDSDKKAHDLLIEAVNNLFVANGKPPIA